MDFPWRFSFIVVSFWDVLYLTVLLAVAWIWAPGPEAFRYAYYSQAADGDADGHGVEMGAAAGTEEDDEEGGACREAKRDILR